MSQPLNNLDIIILIILGLSALIALSRGLIKEVLSIIGWVLGSRRYLSAAGFHPDNQGVYRQRNDCRSCNLYFYSDFVYGYLDSADREHRRQGALQQIKLG